jgi:hypothetical protein
MRKFRLALAALTLVSTAGSFGASHASTPPPNCDKFGSCENSKGAITTCGHGTQVATIGSVNPSPSSGHGVEACSSGIAFLPLAGRIVVYVDPNNNVTVAADGDQTINQSEGMAWDRVDVRPGNTSKPVCVRRNSTGGTYWTNSGGTTSPGTADPTTCGTGHN